MRRTRASTEATTIREVTKPDEQWRQELTPEQYRVLRRAHTEVAFTGAYVHNHRDGFYRCAGCGATLCGATLFSSDAKFNSGTGWPSFDQPAVAEAVELRDGVARVWPWRTVFAFLDFPAVAEPQLMAERLREAFRPYRRSWHPTPSRGRAAA